VALSFLTYWSGACCARAALRAASSWGREGTPARGKMIKNLNVGREFLDRLLGDNARRLLRLW